MEAVGIAKADFAFAAAQGGHGLIFINKAEVRIGANAVFFEEQLLRRGDADRDVFGRNDAGGAQKLEHGFIASKRQQLAIRVEPNARLGRRCRGGRACCG